MDLSAPIADVIPGHRGAIIAALVRLRVPVTGREQSADKGEQPDRSIVVIGETQEEAETRARRFAEQSAY